MAEYIHTQITSYPQIIFSLIALQPVINSSVFLLLAVIHTHTHTQKKEEEEEEEAWFTLVFMLCSL